MTREEMVELRQKLICGDPPYTSGPLGEKLRGSGVPGIEERKVLSDHDANASGIRLVMEAQLKLIDHLLERVRK